METKLTLKLRKNIIEKGKIFAKKRNTSLSRLVENYLDKITRERDKTEVTPLVKSLSGVIKSTKTRKENYAEFLRKKYQ
jgi:hypothetical protein